MSETVVTTTILRILYRKPDSGWSIIKTDQGIAKGEIKFEPKEGDAVKLEGKWAISKRNGDNEFVFKTAIIAVPDEPRALLRYAAELTKGIGPAMEDQIWEAYGAEWREHPLLEGIKAVRRETIDHWQDTLRRLAEQSEQAQAISFLMGKGATLNMASAAWEKWTTETLSIVQRNPYRLADLPHYGFLDVEQGIRQAFEIEDKDPRRIDEATIYSMEQSIGKKGTRLARSEVVNELMRFVPDCIDMVDDCFNRLQAAERIVILDPTWLCMKRDYDNENKIWERFAPVEV